MNPLIRNRLIGLAIAVANIDEVIHIIRSSKDPAEARERLVAQAWPTGDMMPLVDLIADPRTVLVEGDRIKLTDEQLARLDEIWPGPGGEAPKAKAGKKDKKKKPEKAAKKG